MILAIARHELPSFPSNLDVEAADLFKETCFACWDCDPVKRPSILDILVTLKKRGFVLHDIHSMPSEFSLQRKSFEGVIQLMKKMKDMSGANESRIVQYSETWRYLLRASHLII